MTLHWSAATGGFYDTDIFARGLPEDAVEITIDTHIEMMNGLAEGLEIAADAETGQPILTDPPAPSAEQLAMVARSRRQHEIGGLRWLVERHADELALDRSTSLSSANYAALLSHIQALRDVPEQPGFPADIEWPVLPVEINKENT